MNILSFRYGHDSSAAIIVEGKIIADISEERFTRIKNDSSFPLNAIGYCLDQANLKSEDIDVLTVATEIIQKDIFRFISFPKNIKKRYLNKFSLKQIFNSRYKIDKLPIYQKKIKLKESCEVYFYNHHLCHAASAAYTSGISKEEDVLCFTLDGFGDYSAGGVWHIKNNYLKNLYKVPREGSLGFFYGNATEAMNWRHGSEEWKVMGLAPYGNTREGVLNGLHPIFEDGFLKKGIKYKPHTRWNDHGANHYHSENSILLNEVFKKIGKEDFAAEVQRVSEEEASKFIIPWLKRLKIRKAVFSGGFFLNVKFNQKLWESGYLDEQWIYPNPGDSGLAVGAGLLHWYKKNPHLQNKKLFSFYYGPEYSSAQIKKILKERDIKFEEHIDIEEITAKYLSMNFTIGWFQGRCESGPRALGNRSILMSPIDKNNKQKINEKVKYREEFRPFCPSLIEEKFKDYFKNARKEYFMVSSFKVEEDIKKRIPAVIHHDNSARPQLVKKNINKKYHKLIEEFGKITNEYVLLNTSFNIKGEPIVCNPREAIKCFYDTGLDILVIDNFLIRKNSVELIK